MPKIADQAESFRSLKSSGLYLATGPFVFHIQSPLRQVAKKIASLYRDFPIPEENGFADYHVQVCLTTGIRRLIHPQSIFEFDGFRPFHPLPGNQSFALLEWGMNWCIYTHAHEFLILHGAVLEKRGAALIMPAPPGSGKSTLCAALMNRGWRLLSDELTLYDRKTGNIRALARPISLKNASIDIMRRFAPEAFITEPVHDTAKGSVAHMKPSATSVLRVQEPATPAWVVFPRYNPDSATHIDPLPKADVFMELVDNAFNYSTLRENGFRAMADLVDAVDGYRLEYSDLDDIIGRLNRLAETPG